MLITLAYPGNFSSDFMLFLLNDVKAYRPNTRPLPGTFLVFLYKDKIKLNVLGWMPDIYVATPLK